MVKKRHDCIKWNEYFMGIAILTAMRSKDPSTQVGSCLVDKHNRIISTGYNGLPMGWDDDDFEWNRDGKWLQTKYPYVIHSEVNAILNANGYYDWESSALYVTLFPCNECAKHIVQRGIKKIYYLEDKYKGEDSNKAAKEIFDNSGVSYYNIKCNLRIVRND